MPAIEIMENLFFIERGYLNGNHFVYRPPAMAGAPGNGPVLIDTGYSSDFDETIHLIQQTGVDIADVFLIINTHCHCDHIGGNNRIQQQSGCDIALHRIGKHFMDTRDDWSMWWQYYDQEAEFFNCTVSLGDGDKIDIGPHRFRVIHTPGHASDGIVLYNANERVLISSDALWGRDLPVITMRIEGNAALFQAMDSLDRIEALDVDFVYPGHGSPFGDVRDAIDRTRSKITEYMNHRERMGEDLLKRIIVYTLLMRREAATDGFFSDLMEKHWFRETVDLYFKGEYERKYEDVMQSFVRRNIVQVNNGRITTTVKP